MELKFKMAYFGSIYDRYQEASKCLKQKILDEFCGVCKINRKHAIRLLNGPSPEERAYSQRAAKIKRQSLTTYGEQAINLLSKVWEAAGYVCSVRLKAILPLWMPWIEKHFQPDSNIKKQILGISPRQMDRRLSRHKFMVKKRIYGRTKPGALLKHQIPIKTEHWDVKIPGFTEIDTVSHSGNSGSGLFAYSVNQTDIFTGWVETQAVLGKGDKEIAQAIEEMEEHFPFKILGIDSDNGGEFINHCLRRQCESKGIKFTRSRPYKKDDNAHVEQKNWTHVRKLVGWNRYDTKEAVCALNDLYRNELRLFMNLFMPSQKILEKKRIGSKSKRQHDNPQTPLDRVIASGKGDPVKTAYYQKLRNELDPFELSLAINRKLEGIFNKANYHQSPKPSSTSKKPQEKQQSRQSRRNNEILREVTMRLGRLGIDIKAAG